jgi:hypothetical protein
MPDYARRLHADVDPPIVESIPALVVLRGRMPCEFDLLHCPGQHPRRNVGTANGGALPERHILIAQLAQKDAVSSFMVDARPEFLLVDTRKPLVQIKPNPRPYLPFKLAEFLDPSALGIRMGGLVADLQGKRNQR